ncbi:citrate synthase [Neoconidiobolus thromboides FSU 785]|nr:citrate synthase [Neoconidiobolus thromboides FSU 785]
MSEIKSNTIPQQRLQSLKNHLVPQSNETRAKQPNSFDIKENTSGQTFTVQAPDSKDKPNSFHLLKGSDNPNTLTVLDNRTNKIYNIPIDNDTINASDFKKIKDKENESGIMIYDPAFMNTSVARSTITFIDGDKGILHYRGYPIEELAEKSNFLEVSYLLIYGDLPTKTQYDHFQKEVMTHTFLHRNFIDLMKAFNYDAHPMGMFISGVSAMSTFSPDANPALRGTNLYDNKDAMDKQIIRILGKMPTLAALSYRNRIGRPHNLPQNHLSYTENLLFMMDRLSEHSYRPNPKLAKALDVLFILHADHELNCSTAAMRHIGSSRVDPYSAIAGAAAALYGPLHGGANEAVLRMLEDIGSVDQIPTFIQQVKDKKKKLMGFGHRIYKNYDPRAAIIRKTAYEVFEICGRESLIDVAVALEEAARKDPYFVERKLYPNVDFYSGLIYKAMGFPTDFFPVLFAIPRVAGWLAHWKESLADKKAKIWRPRQVYVGETKRSYLPMDSRNEVNVKAEDVSPLSKVP